MKKKGVEQTFYYTQISGMYCIKNCNVRINTSFSHNIIDLSVIFHRWKCIFIFVSKKQIRMRNWYLQTCLYYYSLIFINMTVRKFDSHLLYTMTVIFCLARIRNKINQLILTPTSIEFSCSYLEASVFLFISRSFCNILFSTKYCRRYTTLLIHIIFS